jgi:hypothetical protein
MANVKKILVVDDDPDIVDQVTMILKQSGHEVHSAGTQDEAEEILLSLKPDLAILDLIMEEKDTQSVPIPEAEALQSKRTDRTLHFGGWPCQAGPAAPKERVPICPTCSTTPTRARALSSPSVAAPMQPWFLSIRALRSERAPRSSR